jgi:hypothetical protein
VSVPGGVFPGHDFFFDIEGFDVSAQVIEVDQFQSGKTVGGQERLNGLELGWVRPPKNKKQNMKPIQTPIKNIVHY